VLEAAVSGLEPGAPYVLALSDHPNGSGAPQALAAFKANPAGAAIVNAVGPIRQIVQSDAATPRRYLVIVHGTPEAPGAPAQIE